MTATLELVPYGLREVELHPRDWHPADDCHIDPDTQTIVDAEGNPLSPSMETAVSTSKTQKHNATEEWGSDDW